MLCTNDVVISQASLTRLKQESLIQLLEQYPDRTMFHLVLTYKPYQDIVYGELDVNKFFTKFYLRYFLPSLMKTRNYHHQSKRAIQPICLAFVDEHEHERVYDFNMRSEYSARLHHHAILAVHHEHLDRINDLVGTNTLVNYSHKVMTSYLRECESNTLFYASKMLKQYPDFLSFPDRLNTK